MGARHAAVHAHVSASVVLRLRRYGRVRHRVGDEWG